MADAPGITKLTPLLEEATSVGGGDELARLLATLVAEAKAATGAKYGALGVIGDHGVLSEFLYDGISSELAQQIGHPPTGKGVLGTIIHHQETLILESISEHPDSVGFPEHHPEMETFLGVPVTAGGESFGNLYLTEKAGGFTEEDMVSVEALSHIAGVAVQNFRMNERLSRVAVVEDRQRIAQDLHDSVIQDLFAVGLGLQALTGLADDRVAEGINSAIDTLDDSVATLRKYVFELRESPKPVAGLDERIRGVVERLALAYPTKVELSIEGSHDGPWIDDAVLLTTEALSNALRHARAELIEIELRIERDTQVIEIVDDGKGFDSDRSHPGMGLSSLKARAASTGGWAEIDAKPGRGTKVSVRLPLQE